MKPASSLFARIISWFFLNLMIVAGVLTAFFAFQPQVDLHGIFGQQATNRLRTAAMLITHDLAQSPRTNWSAILARHASIQKVDFMLVLQDETRFSSTESDLPESVIAKVREALRHKLPPGPFPPPPEIHDTEKRPDIHGGSDLHKALQKHPVRPNPPLRLDENDPRPHLVMRTRHPTRYWSGIRILLPPGPSHRPSPGVLLAVSDSVAGNGFFFDPLPWIVVATAVLLISALLWIPMVRNITRPLARMTRATEEIAKGRFDVAIHEPRTDEIGRLAKGINHMTTRLSAFVTGQKRFLGDVAHELGSPIARIQFGLGALEQRVDQENRKRVMDVMEDVDHMSNLVSELLAFSRADLKSKPVQLNPIELLPVVQTSVKRESMPAAEIVIEVDTGIRVVASSELLTRAISNLLRNAIKYAGDQGPIIISAAKSGEHVAITVRDSGPGVSEEYLDRLFDPFFRPEDSRNRESGGVGLGLAIVKTCIDTCKGTVSAANLKPNGFAATITLRTEQTS